MDKKIAQDYFDYKKKMNTVGIIMLIVGLVVTGIAFVHWVAFIIGIAIMLMSLVFRDYIVTDKMYDELIETIKLDVKEKALQKLGLTAEDVSQIDSLAYYGYDYDNCRSRMGEDNVLRTNKYILSYIMFSSHYVHKYVCTFITTLDKSTEIRQECCYRDIAKVSVDYNNIKGDNSTKLYPVFSVLTCGAEAISIRISDSQQANDVSNKLRDIILINKKL